MEFVAGVRCIALAGKRLAVHLLQPCKAKAFVPKECAGLLAIEFEERGAFSKEMAIFL